MKVLVYLFILIASFEIFSKELTFQFRSLSSGNDIYACNAGLRQGPSNKEICVLKDNPSKSCKKNENGCVCKDPEENSHLGNHMLYDISLWNDTDLTWKNPQRGRLTSSSNDKFNELVGEFSIQGIPNYSGANALGIRLNSLTFNLGSELFGASYFVDICYKGPQIEYWSGGDDEIFVKNILFGDISVTDFSSTAFSYIALAGLEVRS